MATTMAAMAAAPRPLFLWQHLGSNSQPGSLQGLRCRLPRLATGLSPRPSPCLLVATRASSVDDGSEPAPKFERLCESKTADAVEWRISENFELYYNCKRLILGDGLGGQSYSVSEELQEVYYLADDYEDTPAGACDPLCSVDEMSSVEFEASYKPNSDFTKAVVIAGSMLAGAAIINHSWVAENQNLAMSAVFGLGYLGIIFEESLAFNKSGVGLLMAVALWVIRSIGAPSTEVASEQLTHSCSEVSEIVFFLLGAMTIVEIIDAHQGFKIVTDSITTRKPRLLLWVVGVITFLLSSVLDNLTSTIVMVSLLRKLVNDPEQRRFLGAVVVIAANSGGAWTPIGDVTTTMLWIHGHISSARTIQDLFIPSAISLIVPLTLMSFSRDAESNSQVSSPALTSEQMAPRGQLVFGVGIGALLFVPVFKSLTGLPPFLGMLLGLGTLWLLTDAIHYGETGRQQLKVPQALSRIDTQGVLFFLGILLSVGSLQSAGILQDLAQYLNDHIPSVELIAGAIGLVSAVIDNVPIVAATMGMYSTEQFPVDSELWQLIAYCAGTGGSILVIGSAAGVAYMGMEKADFLWYLKKVSGYAFAGYVAGIGAYLAALQFHGPILANVSTSPPGLPGL
uniref:Citrate transporter-like domain-containing protein n=2 Tax=Physcomitrium patens TaxID=3218 RepID=A0A7I4DL00_PHYPA